MAFRAGLIVAVAFYLFMTKSDFNYALLLLIIGLYFVEKLIELKWIKNETLYAFLKAVFSYVVFITVGIFLLGVESEQYSILVRLVLWGMLPAAVILTRQ